MLKQLLSEAGKIEDKPLEEQTSVIKITSKQARLLAMILEDPSIKKKIEKREKISHAEVADILAILKEKSKSAAKEIEKSDKKYGKDSEEQNEGIVQFINSLMEE